MLSGQPSQRRQRHGAPSGPWPFVDLEDDVDAERLEDPLNHIPLSASPCEHRQLEGPDPCWCKYPQSLYPNWTQRQQQKSRLLDGIMRTHQTVIRYLDVNSDGMFVAAPEKKVNTHTLHSSWVAIQTERPADVRLRMLFVDNCSGPVLQMIGTRYNVEPFYFSSTIGWTPCRFQSNVTENESDHLTVIFTFIRSTQISRTAAPSLNDSYGGSSRRSILTSRPEIAIDTQTPLALRTSNIYLTLDRLALHMVRSRESGTIISLHPPERHRATTAEQLHTRVHLTGKSVYWCNIFKDTTDPTFVFLSYFWYAIYAWDEALENLYTHISYLESHALRTDKWDTTHELHDIRARLQYYTALLVDFTKSVKFVQETPNPSLGSPTGSREDGIDDSAEREKQKSHSQDLMNRECKVLLSEIDRLERTRHLMELRLKNVMALTFGRIEIEDNKQRQKLTEASLNDNAVMKQLTYLTMVFLPAGFCANVWSMNITVINPDGGTTLWEYFAISLPLTILSIYVIVAYQLEIKVPRQKSADNGFPEDEDPDDKITLELTFWNRVFWPVVLVSVLLDRLKSKKKGGVGSAFGLPN